MPHLSMRWVRATLVGAVLLAASGAARAQAGGRTPLDDEPPAAEAPVRVPTDAPPNPAPFGYLPPPLLDENAPPPADLRDAHPEAHDAWKSDYGWLLAGIPTFVAPYALSIVASKNRPAMLVPSIGPLFFLENNSPRNIAILFADSLAQAVGLAFIFVGILPNHRIIRYGTVTMVPTFNGNGAGLSGTF